MPADRIDVKKVTGRTSEELAEMAHQIIDPAADLAADQARDLHAPAGAIIVTFLALDTDEDDTSQFGVIPVKSVWVLSGPLDEDDPNAPLSSNAERAWAMNILGNAVARRIEPEDEDGRGAYLRELASSLSRLAVQWGYEVTPVVIDDAPTSPRTRTRRSQRPSGRGGRSPKQKRKR